MLRKSERELRDLHGQREHSYGSLENCLVLSREWGEWVP